MLRKRKQLRSRSLCVARILSRGWEFGNQVREKKRRGGGKKMKKEYERGL